MLQNVNLSRVEKDPELEIERLKEIIKNLISELALIKDGRVIKGAITVAFFEVVIKALNEFNSDSRLHIKEKWYISVTLLKEFGKLYNCNNQAAIKEVMDGYKETLDSNHAFLGISKHHNKNRNMHEFVRWFSYKHKNRCLHIEALKNISRLNMY